MDVSLALKVLFVLIAEKTIKRLITKVQEVQELLSLVFTLPTELMFSW